MATTGQLDQILKTLYLPPIRENFNRATVLMNALRVGNEGVSGQNVVTPLWYGYSQGVGARDESQDLPTARKSLYKQSTTSLKTNYGRIELTGHLIRATRDDRGSFIRAVGSEIQNMTAGIKNDYNRQCFGDGTGVLAKKDGGSTSATELVVDSTQYLKVDMPIFMEATASIYRVVDKITSTTRFFTTAAATIQDNKLIYRGEGDTTRNKNIEIMGLKGLVYDTSSTDIQ